MSASPLVAALVLAFTALPWMLPFAPGPSPTVIPWLTSAFCGTVLAALAWLHGWRPPARLGMALAAMALWGGLVTGAKPEVVMLAGALVLVALAASIPADEEAPAGFARAVQWGWLVAAVWNALGGFAQYFGWAAELAPWVSLASVGEAYGNLRQRNQFASLCWMGVAVALFGTLGLRRRWGVALVALLAAAAAASASRTGLLHGVLLGALALVWRGARWPERRWLVAVAAGSYAVAALTLPTALQAFTGHEPNSVWTRLAGSDGCGSRLVLWGNVLRLVALAPLTGWGWGELDYAHFMTLYPGERFCDILDNAHNLPLHLAVELGLPAALAICGGALAWMVRRRFWGEEAPLRQLAWAILFVLLLHSLLEYPLWYGPFQIALGVSLGWLLVRSEPVAAAAWRPVAAAGALALAVAYAGWDYLRVSQVYLAPEERLAPWAGDAMRHARRSWLFSQQATFAELTLAELRPGNVAWVQRTAEAMLHYSPEPRVIERALESATMVERYDEAVLHLARYRAAFPAEYARWREAQKRPLVLPAR